MKLFIKMCLAFILSLLLWEVILENCMFKTTGYTFHPYLGRIYKPGTYIHGTEGYSRTTINSHGMRGPENYAKKANEFRILVLGDSFTEAFQLPDNEIYTHLLQNRLNYCRPKKEITVINAGRSGASPAYYIHLASYYTTIFQPDLVVIQLNEGDFTDDIFNRALNFYVEEKNGNFTSVDNKTFVSANSIIQKHPSLRYLAELSILRIGFDNFQKLLNRRNFNSTQTENSSFEPRPDYRSVISWTMKEFKKKYPHIVLIYLPSLNYKNLAQDKPAVEAFVECYAKTQNVFIINMRAAYIDSYLNTLQPAYGFNNTSPGSGHMNNIGHSLVAEQLANYITTRYSCDIF